MTHSPWAKRLLISGAIILVISATVIWTGWDDFTSAMDPENNHVSRVEGGKEDTVNLSDSRTYIAYRLDSSSTNITITEMQTGTEIKRSSPGILQGDRYGENDRIYTAVGVYNPDADGPHRIENLESGYVLWLVDSEKLGNDDSALLMFEGGCFGIICGVCLLPVGAILWLTSRKNTQPTGLVMETAGGQQIPLAVEGAEIQQRIPTTDEVWASVHGGVPIDLSISPIIPEEEVPPPFADRPDDNGLLPRAIDEIEQVEEKLPDISTEQPENDKQEWKSWDEG